MKGGRYYSTNPNPKCGYDEEEGADKGGEEDNDDDGLMSEDLLEPSSSSSNNDNKNDISYEGGISPPHIEKIIGTTTNTNTNNQKQHHVVQSGKNIRNGKSNSGIIATMHKGRTAMTTTDDKVEKRDGKKHNAGSGGEKKKKNNTLASTKKRLSYGMRGESTTYNNDKDAKGKKKRDEHDKVIRHRDEHQQKQQNQQQSRKRSRSSSGEPRDGRRRSSSSSRPVEKATSRKEKASSKSRHSIQPRTNNKSKSNNKATSQRRHDRQHCASSSSQLDPPTTKSIVPIIRTKSSSRQKNNVQIPSNSKLSQRALISLAKRHNATATQYYATTHVGDTILDKNNFFGTTAGTGTTTTKNNEKCLIEHDMLVIQQDCANARGTYWQCKFSFRHWKLPGQRAVRGGGMYTSLRPVLLATDATDVIATDVIHDREDEGGGLLKKVQPRLILDTSLSTHHSNLVRRFVNEANAGMTPFDYFSESELNGIRDDYDEEKEGKVDDDKEEDVDDSYNDDLDGIIGGGGGNDVFAFDDDGLDPSSTYYEKNENEDVEQQRPAKRKALGDRSNTTANNQPRENVHGKLAPPTCPIRSSAYTNHLCYPRI